jgi:arginine exporter protein ArgO
MGTRATWFLIGAATASVVWYLLVSGANTALLEQILGAR